MLVLWEKLFLGYSKTDTEDQRYRTSSYSLSNLSYITHNATLHLTLEPQKAL